MLDTLKTAGRIWISSLRFMVRSPWLIFMGYLVMLAIEYLTDVFDDLSNGDAPWLDDSIGSYLVIGLGVTVMVIGIALFHLYGMRYAMRFATGRVENWTPLTWCKRLADFVLGLGVYLGLSFVIMPVVVQLLLRLGDRSVIQGDSADYQFGVFVGMCAAHVLLASVVVYVIVRLSLWLPMAAFRRDDQWSVAIAWTQSKSRVVLLVSTLVLFEFVGVGLMLAGDYLRESSVDVGAVLHQSKVVGWYKLGNELEFIANLAERLITPAVFCIVFAIRTSVAANLLGIREPGAQDAYFSYKSRAVPRRTNLSDLS